MQHIQEPGEWVLAAGLETTVAAAGE
jgi:hypothetical protein